MAILLLETRQGLEKYRTVKEPESEENTADTAATVGSAYSFA